MLGVEGSLAAAVSLIPLEARSGLLGVVEGLLAAASARSVSAHPGRPGPDRLGDGSERWAEPPRCAGLCEGPDEGAVCDGVEPIRDCACPWFGAPRQSATVTNMLTTTEWESVDVKNCIGREKRCEKKDLKTKLPDCDCTTGTRATGSR